jgi:hypothetical protein
MPIKLERGLSGHVIVFVMPHLPWPFLRLLACATALSAPAFLLATPWDTPDAVDGDWQNHSWFGWIFDTGNGWIHHEDHGWLFAVGSDSQSIWFFDTDLGWFWSGEGTYPHLYTVQPSGWLHFEGMASSRRVFFAFAQGSWLEISPPPTARPTLSDSIYQWRHREFTASEENELLSWTRNVVTTHLPVKVIETELLRVTLLPDWGARILSIYYKPFDMELLSYAHGDKYSDLIRAEGAFYYNDWLLLPGGINPTFPESEHGKYWGEPWEFVTVEETAESTTVRMSRTDDIDWPGRPLKFDNGLTGMSVDMDITVRKGNTCVELEFTLTNNRDEEIPYEFWMAAALAPLPSSETRTSPNLEIVMKQEKILLRDWWNWMKAFERDDSQPSDDIFMFDRIATLGNWQGLGIAYAWPATDNPWWGVINHDYNFGVLRTIDDIAASPGMKIWGEGSNYGMFELWSGNSQEFFVDAFLQPREVKQWKEYFLPTVEMDAITFANRHGAAYTSSNPGGMTGTIEAKVFSAGQPANAILTITAVPERGAEPVPISSQILNFTPENPTQSMVASFLMEILPQEPFLFEAVLSDYFTGEERMRFSFY